jgi:hypothetical protein
LAAGRRWLGADTCGSRVTDVVRLLLVLAVPLAVGIPMLYMLTGTFRRFMLGGILLGFTLYSGIGAADPGVPGWYLGYYSLLLLACALGFLLAMAVFEPLSAPVGASTSRAFEWLDSYGVWSGVIALFVAVHFVPLLWPEVRIQNLWSPSPPDLTSTFAQQFDGEVARRGSPILYYARLMLTPLFIIALFRLRTRLPVIALLFAGLLYLDYAAVPYVARGTVLVHLGILGIAAWQLRPDLRRAMVLTAVPTVAVALVAAYSYTFVRLGAALPQLDMMTAVRAVWSTESGFPAKVAVPLIESGRTIDFERYLVWTITLPTPKVILGAVDVPLVNYEISEIVLGLPMGDRRWYVVLGGLVAESVYIFGRAFFWLHGLLLGGLAGFMTRLVERTPQLIFLQAYLVMLFAFSLNRAGVASLLPTVVNQFILVYALIVFGLLMHPWGARPEQPIAQ